MVEFINRFTKTRFWVADDRVDEYKAAGYTPAADLEKPKVEEIPKAEEVIEAEPKAEEVKEEIPEEISEVAPVQPKKKTASKKAKK